MWRVLCAFQPGGRSVHRCGVGLAVLWRANPSWKQNLFITGLTWAAGAFVGVAMQVIVALLV